MSCCCQVLLLSSAQLLLPHATARTVPRCILGASTEDKETVCTAREAILLTERVLLSIPSMQRTAAGLANGA